MFLCYEGESGTRIRTRVRQSDLSPLHVEKSWINAVICGHLEGLVCETAIHRLNLAKSPVLGKAQFLALFASLFLNLENENVGIAVFGVASICGLKYLSASIVT